MNLINDLSRVWGRGRLMSIEVGEDDEGQKPQGEHMRMKAEIAGEMEEPA